jgi:hypothetical protein
MFKTVKTSQGMSVTTEITTVGTAMIIIMEITVIIGFICFHCCETMNPGRGGCLPSRKKM